jgi:hypothetical protein
MSQRSTTEVQFNSRFSFKPLMRVWEKAISEGKEGSRQFYSDILEKVRKHPELLEAITDEAVLEKHSLLIEQMMTTIFPVTLSDTLDLYAVSLPFQFRVIYSSSIFRRVFMDSTGKYICIPDSETAERIYSEKYAGAYQILLNRLYNIRVDGTVTSVHPYKCPDTGLERFMELELDTQFIDVIAKKPLPDLPQQFCQCCRISDLVRLPDLDKHLPLEDFEFEGMVIVRIKDVTEREIVNKIKNSLLNIHSFADHQVFTELQAQIRNLLGVDGVHTAIKPFFKVNNHLVFTDLMTSSGSAKSYKDISQEKKHEVFRHVHAAFKSSPKILLIEDLTEEKLFRYPFLAMLQERGFKNALLCPLFTSDKELLGMLVIASHEAHMLTTEHMSRMESILPLFTLALEKSQEQLDHQVDKVIKEQFTAVQDAVEWRFTEAALNYLTKKDIGKSKIEPIIFENVFPLYGAIDIRNSSVERNNAIQLDMLEQLAMAHRIIGKAKENDTFPLLDEIQFKIERYTHSVTNILFAEEEMAIHHFLVDELASLFRHLLIIMPVLEADIHEYMEAIDSPVRMVYHHRKAYEESITKINTELAAFIDSEQAAAQNIFPHYFERFVTDGLDFNIYIGQAISPDLPFDAFYLKNLKIWQLTTLVKAAQLANKMESQLPLKLQTTQLILAHSHPISISFRTAERKFDVDGAYNIRYEIIKKRIDKVHIRDTHERLTKPGTISIVYSQPKEAEEYIGFIEYLQNKGLLKDDLEKHDLEELQGVVGLRGLRVSVNMETAAEVLPREAAPAVGATTLSKEANTVVNV